MSLFRELYSAAVRRDADIVFTATGFGRDLAIVDPLRCSELARKCLAMSEEFAETVQAVAQEGRFPKGGE